MQLARCFFWQPRAVYNVLVEIYQMANIEFQPKMGSTPETMGQVLVQRCHLILLFLTTKSLQKNMLCVVYS